MDATRLSRLTGCPAPAKLNLFLHIVGRRDDGYHLLQSVFRLIDWEDSLSFEARADGQLRLHTRQIGVSAEQNLCFRSAQLLQQHTDTHLGADIWLEKRLPMGGGLGGGSSDAATTLIALNRLWQTGLPRHTLAELGLRLGADVPFFIWGTNAFVEGVGERVTPIRLSDSHYVVVHPGIHVSTKDIFCAPELTRNTKSLRIMDFAYDATRNDMQPIACGLHPEVGEAIEWLEHYAPARMTGSGACIFAEVSSLAEAQKIVAACPEKWLARSAKGLSSHPLSSWVE